MSDMQTALHNRIHSENLFPLPPEEVEVMKVLVACERSGAVREAFRRLGHDAWSCDIVKADDNSKHHIKEDVLNVLHWNDWDMMIAFPPCTHLCSSGARWWPDKKSDGRQQQAIDFFMSLVRADIPKIAIENPIGIMSTEYRRPDQIIHPWQFGHGETKATCLWLQNLPLLKPTEIVDGREPRIHRMPPSKDRSYLRSITFPGVASGMAAQWGFYLHYSRSEGVFD